MRCSLSSAGCRPLHALGARHVPLRTVPGRRLMPPGPEACSTAYRLSPFARAKEASPPMGPPAYATVQCRRRRWRRHGRLERRFPTCRSSRTRRRAQRNRRSMTIGLAARVALRDLATQLGAYRTIAESKTSSVGFVAPGSTAQIFADLLSSRVLPDAPVIEVVARAPQVRRRAK